MVRTNTPLTPEQRKKIRDEFYGVEPDQRPTKISLAKKYNTSPRTVGRILKKEPVKKVIKTPKQKLSSPIEFKGLDNLIITNSSNEKINVSDSLEFINLLKLDPLLNVKLKSDSFVQFTFKKHNYIYYSINHKNYTKESDISDLIRNVLYCLDQKVKLAEYEDFIQKAKEEQDKIICEVDESLDNVDWDNVPFIFNGSMLTMTISNKPYSMSSENPEFSKVVELVMNKEYEKAYSIINKKTAIKSYSNGLLKIVNDKVYYQGLELNNGMTKHIIKLMAEGERSAFDHFVKFFENVLLNPSKTAIDELFLFIEASDIEIDEDGYLVCFRYCNSNYTDCHTGTMDNSIGASPSVPRNYVDERRDVLCSKGLHCCAKSYLSPMNAYGGGKRILKVKVHPKDVVCIPKDYDNAKMRTCGFTVIEDITDTFKK